MGLLAAGHIIAGLVFPSPDGAFGPDELLAICIVRRVQVRKFGTGFLSGELPVNLLVRRIVLLFPGL